MKICITCEKEKSLIDFRPYRNQCKKCHNETVRTWQRANSERFTDSKKHWEDANPESKRSRNKKYRLKNPDKTRLSNKEQKARRRAVKSGCITNITTKQWKETLEEFNWSCFWCEAPWEHQEHIVALSNGGPHSKGNVVPSCRPCNQRKRSKDPLIFYFQSKGF